MNTCTICQKQYKPTRSSSKFCSGACRIKAKRLRDGVVKHGLSVTLSVTNNPSHRKEIEDTVTDRLNKLTFTDENLEERIAKYKEIMGEYTFVPNWILHGFHSKEEAIKYVMSGVRKNEVKD